MTFTFSVKFSATWSNVSRSGGYEVTLSLPNSDTCVSTLSSVFNPFVPFWCRMEKLASLPVAPVGMDSRIWQ